MTDPKEVFLVDTNVLVYAYDKSDSKKHFVANKLLQKCWNREINYAISVQNLAEFFFIVTEKIKNLELNIAKQIVKDIIRFPNWIVVNYNKETILNAIDIKIMNRNTFWDALIIATMLENSVFNIYTENEKDFNNIKNITVVNPFK